MKPAQFLSDLHLAPGTPALARAFVDWAHGPAHDASAVYVLGDLFDAWIGDEQVDEPFFRPLVAALRSLADAGVPVAIVRGNRDFLLGERFARAAGATLLPERSTIDAGGVRTLILHGDELCTGDADYQRYRAWVRDPRHQRRLLALPWPVRRAVAAWLRRKSRLATMRKPEAILDVDEGAVADALRTAGVARLIHGHTHRPASHRITVDGRDCERHVLPDWRDRAVWLDVDTDGVRRREGPA
ncbi:MAG: UDP-2,3-diacylglucosamine diphosphatase [Burkholderiales bacterium]